MPSPTPIPILAPCSKPAGGSGPTVGVAAAKAVCEGEVGTEETGTEGLEATEDELTPGLAELTLEIWLLLVKVVVVIIAVIEAAITFGNIALVDIYYRHERNRSPVLARRRNENKPNQRNKKGCQLDSGCLPGLLHANVDTPLTLVLGAALGNVSLKYFLLSIR